MKTTNLNQPQADKATVKRTIFENTFNQLSADYNAQIKSINEYQQKGLVFLNKCFVENKIPRPDVFADVAKYTAQKRALEDYIKREDEDVDAYFSRLEELSYFCLYNVNENMRFDGSIESAVRLEENRMKIECTKMFNISLKHYKRSIEKL